MRAFQFLLGFFSIGICAYTLAAGNEYGWDLFTPFFGELTAFTWSGQFNFDFSTYLMLSGIWIAWRHQFSLSGILMAIVAAIFGILFFAPYLLVESIRTKGDMKELLLGKSRIGN